MLPLAALAARVRRLPLIVTVHCSLSYTLDVCDVRTALLRAVGGRIERRAECRAVATIVFTSRLADLIARDAGGSVHFMRAASTARRTRRRTGLHSHTSRDGRAWCS
jgi:hypothetical protein